MVYIPNPRYVSCQWAFGFDTELRNAELHAFCKNDLV